MLSSSGQGRGRQDGRRAAVAACSVMVMYGGLGGDGQE
jgi:hypothetical protein